MDLDLPKDIMGYIMPTFDILAALLMFYMAIQLTRDFGFGNWRQWLLFGHRCLLFAASFSFAYHAFDIWRDPYRHGLTLSNFQLHVILVSVAVFSALRITLSEKPQYQGTNGGGFVGPFGRKKGAA